MKYLFLITLFYLTTSVCLAQDGGGVTIGSNIKPVTGALLDLKQYESSSTNETAKKGLMLPRVELTTLTSLSDIEDADLTSLTSYAGLIVYNVSTSITEGVYLWTGSEWILIQSSI